MLKIISKACLKIWLGQSRIYTPQMPPFANNTTEKLLLEWQVDDLKEHWRKVKNALTCTFCYDAFSEPVVIPCGHSFCKKCIETWRRINNSRCPMRCGDDYLERNWTLEVASREIKEIEEHMNLD